VAKLVARLLATASLDPDTSQKYKMDDENKGVANTLEPAKKYTKKEYMSNANYPKNVNTQTREQFPRLN
jgi:hypothetical protein